MKGIYSSIIKIALLTALHLIPIFGLSQSQTDTCRCPYPSLDSLRLCDTFNCCPEMMAATLVEELPTMDTSGDYDGLVTYHTFRRIYVKGMAKILSLDNATATMNRYATISIDEDKSTFSFSPYAGRIHKRQEAYEEETPTHFFFSTFIKGKINKEGFSEIFKGKEWNKEFTVGGSLSFALGIANNYLGDSKDSCGRRKIQNFRIVQQGLPAELCKKYRKVINDIKANDINAYISQYSNLDDCEDLQGAMRKEFSETEEKIADPLWTAEYRLWFSLAPEFGIKSLVLLDTVKQSGVVEKSYKAASVKASANFYLRLYRTYNLFVSIGAALNRQNVFSDAATQSWNKYNILKDTSFLISTSKDAYLYDGKDIEHKFLPTISAQVLQICNWKKFGIGFDINLSRTSLFPTPTQKNGNKVAESYGIVFPFNDKNGERTVNITVFYQHNTFNNSTIPDDEFYGLKFAVPIFSSSEK